MCLQKALGMQDYFEFNFHDGTTYDFESNSSHAYLYHGYLHHYNHCADSFCDVSSQTIHTIEFDNDANVPTVSVLLTDSCRYGGVDVVYTNVDSTMIFQWDFSGTPDTGMIPTFR